MHSDAYPSMGLPRKACKGLLCDASKGFPSPSRVRLQLSLLCLLSLVFGSCSLHRYQGPEDQLYIGVKSITVVDKPGGSYADHAIGEAEEKLNYAPNGSIFGSSSLRWPLPLMSPYLYMRFSSDSTFIARVLRRFTSKPVWMREVSPSLRAKVAQQTLREHGYLSATVRSEILPQPKDSLQARVSYQMQLGPLYLLDSVTYFPRVHMSKGRYFEHGSVSELQKGTPFSMEILERDRNAISTYLRQFGYYYLKPDYISYQADTLMKPQHVALRTVLAETTPMDALRQWKIGRVQLRLMGRESDGGSVVANDSLALSDSIMLYYRDKTLVRPAVLRTRIRMKEGEIYRHKDEERTLSALTNLGAFSSVEFYFAKREEAATSPDSLVTVLAADSLGDNPHPAFTMQPDTTGTLDVTILLRPDKPWSTYLGAAFMRKSTSYIGPGVSASIERSNLFGGGERLTANVYGSYEWQTGRSPVAGSSISINSYQLGGDIGITFPFILFPGWINNYYKYPTSTSFKVGIQGINHAQYYTLRSLAFTMDYSFQPSSRWSHRLSPLSLNYTQLTRTTARFDKLLQENPALGLSLRNQFIPKVGYYFTYTRHKEDSPHFFQIFGEVSEAGNLTNGLMAAFGRPYNETKTMLGVPFAQFVKASMDLRYSWRIDRNQTIATRLATGAIYSFGNASTAPYIEQYYVGGANSIRAFTVRSIGPGRFRTQEESAYSFMDRVGEMKLEGNVEYRGRLFGDCYGAVFLDAGNIWLLRRDPDRPGASLGELASLSEFARQIAVGTGVGVRYDLSFLVVRFDVGIGLHLPYETSRKGWYNIPRFRDALGLHLAIGYPF